MERRAAGRRRLEEVSEKGRRGEGRMLHECESWRGNGSDRRQHSRRRRTRDEEGGREGVNEG